MTIRDDYARYMCTEYAVSIHKLDKYARYAYIQEIIDTVYNLSCMDLIKYRNYYEVILEHDEKLVKAKSAVNCAIVEAEFNKNTELVKILTELKEKLMRFK